MVTKNDSFALEQTYFLPVEIYQRLADLSEDTDPERPRVLAIVGGQTHESSVVGHVTEVVRYLASGPWGPIGDILGDEQSQLIIFKGVKAVTNTLPHGMQDVITLSHRSSEKSVYLSDIEELYLENQETGTFERILTKDQIEPSLEQRATIMENLKL